MQRTRQGDTAQRSGDLRDNAARQRFFGLGSVAATGRFINSFPRISSFKAVFPYFINFIKGKYSGFDKHQILVRYCGIK